GHDLVDALFHAMEVGEGGVAADHLVGEDPRQPRVGGGVQQLGRAYGHQHAFGRSGVGAGVGFAQLQIFLQGIFFLPGRLESLLEVAEYAHDCTSLDCMEPARVSRAGAWEYGCAAVGESPRTPQSRYRWPGTGVPALPSGWPCLKSSSVSAASSAESW